MDILGKTCKICAKNTSLIQINEESKVLIKNTLMIEILVNDKSKKYVCFECISTLKRFQEMKRMVVSNNKRDETLVKRISLGQNDAECPQSEEYSSDDDFVHGTLVLTRSKIEEKVRIQKKNKEKEKLLNKKKKAQMLKNGKN